MIVVGHGIHKPTRLVELGSSCVDDSVRLPRVRCDGPSRDSRPRTTLRAQPDC